MSHYYTKVLRTKTRLYTWHYSNPIYYGFPTTRSQQEKQEKAIIGAKREDSLTRTRNNAKVLLELNLTPYTKFLTLTYAKAPSDRQQVIKDFNSFIKRFNKERKAKLQYLYVQEQGKSNTKRWHVHAVLFHDEYIPARDLARIWGKGHVKVNAIDDYRNIGLYLVKYITKDIVALNKKGYISSLGLIKPEYERITTTSPVDTRTADYTYTYTRKYLDKQGNQVEQTCTVAEYSLIIQ